jgi:hypothetical protein
LPTWPPPRRPRAAAHTGRTDPRRHGQRGRTIGGDPANGRLLFSAQLANAVLVRKRVESRRAVRMLSGRHVENALRVRRTTGSRPPRISWSAGGATISAWLAVKCDSIPISSSTSSRHCSTALADPSLYRD